MPPVIREKKPPFFLVNAFTATPHGGNQAAVVLFSATSARREDEAYMAAVARDFELPMTAFLVPRDESGKRFAIRWFTKTGFESELCGHASLASALVLFARFSPDTDSITFDTRFKGRIVARRVVDQTARGGFDIALSLPLGPAATGANLQGFEGVIKAVGVSTDNVVAVSTYDNAASVIVEVKPDVPVRDLPVDTSALASLVKVYTLVTQTVSPGRINSRVFIPNKGIPEDPVTGSAHAVLTDYWLQGGGKERIGGVSVLDAQQVSARGGALKCSIIDGRAQVIGKGWITASGVLEL